MHESVTVTCISDISKTGSFWPFLATFGIENGSMITLPIFDDLKSAKNMYNIREPNIKLKIA